MLRTNEHGSGALQLPHRIVLLTLITLVAVGLAAPPRAEAIPSFARRYEVSCAKCHVIPPKLNEFGERFAAAGYRSPELEPTATVPVSLWVSGRAERRPVDGEQEVIDPYLNRGELISGGQLLRPWLSYFVEWRVLSQESQGDGSLRDRSGRFEDAYVVAAPDEHLAVTVGQFRLIDQVDVSRRLSLSEPLALSASLPGEGGSTPRRRSLRAFSPSGRSPALRVAWSDTLASGWEWTASAAVPMPGELSIPLNSEARRQASNEIELRPKGVVLEGFVRRGVASYGAHVFYDSADRYLLNAVAAGRRGPLYWTAVAGFDEVAATRRGRWSIEGEYLPGSLWGVGARLEDRAGDGAEPALLPYATWHPPLPRALRTHLALTLEQRLQEDSNATLLEVGLLW